MEVEKIISSYTTTVCKEEDDDDDDVSLPGFRFHPTDEELVGFYLRRKIEKKPFSIELIKDIDIYKYDPWDLPKGSNAGDREWYFFCKRGRKYRNSIRPNRVTGSGFWKATGIDRPIYSSAGEGRDCIGLKKSLVYYRGCAGKGTKTDWMMHEFRLPADHDKATKHIDTKSITQEAEVWTLCRIFKRNATYKKCIPDWKEMATAAAANKHNSNISAYDSISKTSCNSTVESNNCYQSYISFNNSQIIQQNERKPFANYSTTSHVVNDSLTSITTENQFMRPPVPQVSSMSTSSYQSFWSSEEETNEFLKNADWEDLRSVAQFDAGDQYFVM